jgi:hypothetical protein
MKVMKPFREPQFEPGTVLKAWNAAYSAATFRFVFIMCAALLPLLFVDHVFLSAGT